MDENKRRLYASVMGKFVDEFLESPYIKTLQHEEIMSFLYFARKPFRRIGKWVNQDHLQKFVDDWKVVVIGDRGITTAYYRFSKAKFIPRVKMHVDKLNAYDTLINIPKHGGNWKSFLKKLWFGVKPVVKKQPKKVEKKKNVVIPKLTPSRSEQLKNDFMSSFK